MRRGPSLEITRCCLTSTELPGELGHPGYGTGTIWRGALIVAKGNCTQNSISVVKIFRVFQDESSLIDDLVTRHKLRGVHHERRSEEVLGEALVPSGTW